MMRGKLREVITDRGVFYYQIESGETFDNLYIYRKKKITEENWMGKQTESTELIPVGGGDSDNGYIHFIDKTDSKSKRIKYIQNKIKEAVAHVSAFDPEWDGLMIEDKDKLKSILMTILDQ